METAAAVHAAVASALPNAATVWPPLQQAWQRTLQRWAKNGQLNQAVVKGLGLTSTPAAINQLSQQLAAGNFSGLPPVELLPSSTIGTQQAAYGLNTGAIYLNSDWLIAATEPEVTERLTHELGHHLSHTSGSPTHVNAEAEKITSLLLKGKLPPLRTPSGNNSFSFKLSNGTDVQAEGFGTTMHTDAIKQILPMLNNQAIGIITTAQNDTDALSGDFSAQYDEFSHFDNGNVAASVNYIRLRYKDAVDNLYNKNVNFSSNEEGPLISRWGIGYGDVLYRFGQITHALQDFYSHSNWIDLIKLGALQPNQLLDGGWGGEFPEIKPWGKLSDKVWVLESGLSDYSTPLGTPYYWYVNGYDKAPYALFASDKNDKLISSKNDGKAADVLGLTTGAVNDALYGNDKTPWVYNFINRASPSYYGGITHGGIAGQQFGTFGPARNGSMYLAKDAVTDNYHQEAFDLANKQVQNEFARLMFLLKQKWGDKALIEFRGMGIKSDQVANFNKQFLSNTNKLQSLPLDSFGKTRSEQSHTSTMMEASKDTQGLNQLLAPFYPKGNPNIKGVNPGWATPNLQTRLTPTQINNDLRWIKVFSAAQPGQPSLLLQIKNAAGQWVDTEVDGAALRNYSTDFSLAPAAKPHWQQGLRGMLTTAGTAAAKGDRQATRFSVESTNRGARVAIDDFDVCSDSIELVNPSDQKTTNVSSINLANYVQQSKALLRDHNISLNATPELRSQKRAVRITNQDWAKANGTPSGFALKASDLFFDPDNLPGSTKSQTLRFTAYNEAIPWLKLNNGQLVLDRTGLNGKRAPSPGQYNFSVCATDGTARSDYLSFSLSYEPTVTVGKQQIPAGSQASFAFAKPGASALELYGQVIDAAGTPVESARLIATQVGNSRATPRAFGLAASTSSISDAYCAGTLTFFLKDQAKPNSTIPLTVQASTPTGFSLRSADGSHQITATYSTTKTPTARFSNLPVGMQTLVGMRLSKPNSADPKTPHTHQVKLNVDVFREAASAQNLRTSVGLYLADALTGAVLNPSTGAVINSSLGLRDTAALGSYRDDAVTQAVWSTELNQGTTSQSPQFSVSSSLNWDNLIAVPFVRTEEQSGTTVQRNTYIGNDTANADKVSHITVIGSNMLGVETDSNSVVPDFNDVLFNLKSVVVT